MTQLRLLNWFSRNGETAGIGLMYFLLFAGGLWHILGVFQHAMQVLASPLLIAISLIALGLMLRQTDRKGRFLLWAVVLFVGGFLAETIGVKTGLVFGNYMYGDILQPQIAGVPVAIGFAWIGIELSSLAVARSVVKRRLALLPVITALLMVGFDVLMEPSAEALGYWHWQGGIPLQNYLAWFVLGLLFAYIGRALKVLQTPAPRWVWHAYWAQLLYFVMINLS